jgi:glutathione S-transferase
MFGAHFGTAFGRRLLGSTKPRLVGAAAAATTISGSVGFAMMAAGSEPDGGGPGRETAVSRSVPKPTILYGAWFCPFVQRAWIALEEKGVEYQWQEINPYEDGQFGKATKLALPLEEKRRRYPDFVAASPSGLVPAIVHEGSPISGSMVCLEFIEEQWPQRAPLLPPSAAERAHVRQWSTFASEKIIPFYYKMLMSQDEAGREAARRATLSGLAAWSDAMRTRDGGPFFLGASFSYADASLFPWMERLLTVGAAYRNFELPDEPRFDRLRAWHEACRRRPSVRATLADEEKLVANYQGYADNSATSAVAKSVRGG